MAGINLQGGYGAGGAVDALRVLVAENLRAKAQADQVAQEQARLAEAQARRGEDARQFSVTTAQTAEQNQLGREQQKAILDLTQKFQSTESQKGRDFTGTENQLGRDFTGTQNQLGRDFTGTQNQLGREFTGTQNALGRAFTGEENAANRANAVHLENLGGANALERARITAGGAAAGQDNASLADMILKNPDLLQTLQAKDRSAVLREIASGGGEMPNRRRSMMQDMVSGAEKTITALETHPGLAGAVGTKGPSSLFGLMGSPIAGTDAAGYVKLIDQLKSQLTMPRLEMMRGLGAMSDREFQNVVNSITSLDRSLPEADFKRELGNLKTNLGSARKMLGMPESGGTGGTPEQRPIPGIPGGIAEFRDGKWIRIK